MPGSFGKISLTPVTGLRRVRLANFHLSIPNLFKVCAWSRASPHRGRYQLKGGILTLEWAAAMCGGARLLKLNGQIYFSGRWNVCDHLREGHDRGLLCSECLEEFGCWRRDRAGQARRPDARGALRGIGEGALRRVVKRPSLREPRVHCRRLRGRRVSDR